MKIHIFRVTHQFVVDIPDDRDEEMAMTEALALVKAGKVEPEAQCDAQHVGIIPKEIRTIVPKDLKPGDVLRKLTRLSPDAAYKAANAVGLLDPGDPIHAHDRAMWLSVVMQRAAEKQKFPALFQACDTEGRRKTGS